MKEWAYLNYLTNLYRKKNIRMDAENKPEYAVGSADLLEQKYSCEYVPVLDDASGIWCVQTGYGFECEILIILHRSSPEQV